MATRKGAKPQAVNQELSKRELEVALDLCERMDTPRSLSVAILLRRGDYEGLLSLRDIQPADYRSALAYYLDAQATALVEKLRLGWELPGTEERTLEKWLLCEKNCLLTNQRMAPYIYNSSDLDVRLADFVRRVKKEVRFLIGTLREIPMGSFGPGATVSDPSRRCTIADKITSEVTLTEGAVMCLPFMKGTAWARAIRTRLHDNELSLVRGNSYFSVAKKLSIRRPCAKEPSLNAFFQRGLGLEMVSRLRKKGIDMELLPEEHKKLARLGSIDGSLATIDLSSASDTLAIFVVKLLLPDCWFEALDALRSKFTEVDGRWHRLEKFSSMGNGFTFELETIIFRAIAVVCCGSRERVSVFGDDIIVPADKADSVISALKWFGFTPNPSKTHIRDQFRESCGGDYFEGKDVRPFFWKNRLEEPQHYISLYNGIEVIKDRLGDLGNPDLRIDLVQNVVRRGLPKNLRTYGPKILGDLCLHSEDRDRWSSRTRSCIRYIKVYRPITGRYVRLSRYDDDVVLAVATWLAGSGPLRGPVQEGNPSLTPRDAVIGYKLGWVPYS